MKKTLVIVASLACILTGCSRSSGPDDVVSLHYASTARGDFDSFLSCLSASAREEFLTHSGGDRGAREAFSELSDEVRELSKSARITKTKVHGTNAMVWVTEGDTMPEDGKVFSLSQQGGQWVITGKQMLVSYYKNASKLDWEKTTEQSSRHGPK